MAVLLVAGGWVAGAFVLAVAVGRAIRVADEREQPQRPVLTVVRDAA